MTTTCLVLSDAYLSLKSIVYLMRLFSFCRTQMFISNYTEPSKSGKMPKKVYLHVLHRTWHSLQLIKYHIYRYQILTVRKGHIVLGLYLALACVCT